MPDGDDARVGAVATLRTCHHASESKKRCVKSGVLLMAFAPLDGLLQPREQIPWPRSSFFLALGIFLFALAIVFARRYSV